jgi:polynucleotide 5'-triphosphatase
MRDTLLETVYDVYCINLTCPAKNASMSPPPSKRARLTQPPSQPVQTPNGLMRDSLPPLSLSILGVEPLDEFIKEIADFVHHMIQTRPDLPGASVEVEAKVGVLRDKVTGLRIAPPVLVETSMYIVSLVLTSCSLCNPPVLAPEVDCRFESNMSAVS